MMGFRADKSTTKYPCCINLPGVYIDLLLSFLFSGAGGRFLVYNHAIHRFLFLSVFE